MSDATDIDIYEAVAGDAGKATQSVSQHLTGLPSEELLSLADDLTALLAHPGWQKLEERAARFIKTIGLA